MGKTHAQFYSELERPAVGWGMRHSLMLFLLMLLGICLAQSAEDVVGRATGATSISCSSYGFKQTLIPAQEMGPLKCFESKLSIETIKAIVHPYIIGAWRLGNKNSTYNFLRLEDQSHQMTIYPTNPNGKKVSFFTLGNLKMIVAFRDRYEKISLLERLLTISYNSNIGRAQDGRPYFELSWLPRSFSISGNRKSLTIDSSSGSVQIALESSYATYQGRRVELWTQSIVREGYVYVSAELLNYLDCSYHINDDYELIEVKCENGESFILTSQYFKK